MLHWLWVHNAGVIGFAAGLAKYRSLEPYLNDTPLVHQSIIATRELYNLCERRGVQIKNYPEAGFIFWPLWLVTALLRWNFRRNESMQRYTAHATSPSSLQESKYHYDHMLATASQLGFEMPAMKALGAYL